MIRQGRPQTVVVVGAALMMVEALAFMLDTEPGLRATSVALNELMSHSPQTPLDTVLIDVTGYSRSLLSDSLSRLQTTVPQAAVAIVAPSRASCWDELALDLGVARYLTWDMERHEVIEAVRRLADHEPAGQARADRGAHDHLLTGREREVLWLLHEGHAIDQISAELRISRRTVDTHLQNLMGKLDTRTRRDTLSTARELGIVPEHREAGQVIPRAR